MPQFSEQLADRKRHAFPYLILCLFMAVMVIAGCKPAEEAEQSATISTVPVAAALPADTTHLTAFNQLMHQAASEKWFEQPLGITMTAVGQWFEGQPYVAGSLDKSPFEELVIKLDGFDCVTFVESVLALSRVIQDQSYSYPEFVGYMEAQRYRDGNIDGYCSRLHYFSEWIWDNEKRGAVENVTQAIGGVVFDKQIDFMSQHRDSYAALKSDSLYAGIIAVEESLKDLTLYYIPQNEISNSYSKLQAGDIIALATDIGGLDVAHTGFVYKHEDGNAGLLHASTAHGVIVSPDLQQYVENNKRQVGIVVARPLNILDEE